MWYIIIIFNFKFSWHEFQLNCGRWTRLPASSLNRGGRKSVRLRRCGWQYEGGTGCASVMGGRTRAMGWKKNKMEEGSGGTGERPLCLFIYPLANEWSNYVEPCRNYGRRQDLIINEVQFEWMWSFGLRHLIFPHFRHVVYFQFPLWGHFVGALSPVSYIRRLRPEITGCFFLIVFFLSFFLFGILNWIAAVFLVMGWYVGFVMRSDWNWTEKGKLWLELGLFAGPMNVMESELLPLSVQMAFLWDYC